MKNPIEQNWPVTKAQMVEDLEISHAALRRGIEKYERKGNILGLAIKYMQDMETTKKHYYQKDYKKFRDWYRTEGTKRAISQTLVEFKDHHSSEHTQIDRRFVRVENSLNTFSKEKFGHNVLLKEGLQKVGQHHTQLESHSTLIQQQKYDIQELRDIMDAQQQVISELTSKVEGT